MATSSMSSTLGLLALRQQRSQLRNDKLVHDIERATMGLPRVSTKRLEHLKRQYLDLVAAQQENNSSTAVPSAAPITRHDSSSIQSPSSATPSNHGSPPPSNHKSSAASTPKKLDVQLSSTANHDPSPHSSPSTTPVSHSSAGLSSTPSPTNQQALPSPSNQCLLSPSSSLSSSCPPPLQTTNHSSQLPHSHHTPSSSHSPAISKQNSPSSFKNRTSTPPCELPIISAKPSKADKSASDHSSSSISSHLLLQLGEDNSSLSSLSSPFTPVAVEKPVANSSSVLMEVDRATQEIRVEENLEEKVVNGEEQKLNLSSPVRNGVPEETNEEIEVESSLQNEQVEEDCKSVSEESKMSQKKDSSSVNESDSDDFWGSGSIDDLPLPEENNEKKEKQNEVKEEENEEKEEVEIIEEKVEEETKDKEDKEESDEETDEEDDVVQDHVSIVQHMLRSLNDRLRKDREEAKYLYMDGSPTDDMKGLIVGSKVLTAVLTRVSGEGCEISSWDSRAVAAVLREELREMISSEGPLISRESSKLLETFNDSLKTPWKEVWSLVVEHARLVFQCGQSLESVAAAFSVLEEGERSGVLQNLLEASCGVEQTSWSAHDDTISSSSSGQNGNDSEVHAVSESDAYRSLLLQSSLVLNGELSSDEADSDIEQQIHKFSDSKPLSPVHRTLLVSSDQASFTKTSAQPNNDISIASSTSSLSGLSLPEVATSKPIISTSDIAKRTTMMKRMGLLDVSESETSDAELHRGLNDTTEDFDFYS